MNLHEWITAKVDGVEAEHRSVVLVPDGGKPIVGTVTDAMLTADGVELTVVPGLAVTAAVLRRCEADRRILARHKQWAQSSYCDACDADPTTRLNDCPELLDLAHAHGITPEILTGLDRPQPPEPKPVADQYANGGILTPPITTSDVPAALRGTRWKPHH